MSPYWQNMLKSLGNGVLAGFYGMCTVILARKALHYRDRAFNCTGEEPHWKIETTAATREEADAIHKAASDAAYAKASELKNRKANGKETKPEAGK